MMLVITKRTLISKVASLKVRKGKIVPYDPDTQSIIINYLTFQIHMEVVMDKDITSIPWDKLKKRITKSEKKNLRVMSLHLEK